MTLICEWSFNRYYAINMEIKYGYYRECNKSNQKNFKSNQYDKSI